MRLFIKAMGIALSVAFLICSSLNTARAFDFKPKVIYGEDHRADLYQIERTDLLDVADSTVAMIANKSLQKIDETTFKIKFRKYGIENELCKSEPFYDQPVAASCSGFLVGEDLIATAGHCMGADIDCEKYSFVFGFKMKNANEFSSEVAADEVYKCQKILVSETTSRQDYALIKLDRPVRGHKVLALYNQPLNLKQDIFVVGHPSGLPTKLAGGAQVRAQKESHFIANLDTYGGNSGSAVFDAATLQVAGILVRGEEDFIYDSKNKCNRSNVCKDHACRGEDVTYISYIAKALTQH